MGVKFGRYHVYLFKLMKPEAVLLRLILWKNFHQKYFDLKPPTFGLNFVEKNKAVDSNFMLLCGFEKFENFFVRIDILERLFVKIINSNLENSKEVKLTAEMLNLLGCSKENFVKLIKRMNYKIYKKNDDFFFKYLPSKSNNKKYIKKNNNKDNPFNILKQINFEQ